MGFIRVGIFQVGIFLDGNCPGENYTGWEFSLVEVFHVGFVRSESSGWQFSGWEFSCYRFYYLDIFSKPPSSKSSAFERNCSIFDQENFSFGGKVKHELWVASYEVRYANYEFKFTSFEFKSPSCVFKSTTY